MITRHVNPIEQAKGERLLEIDNVHSDSCGPPPSIVIPPAKPSYLGYFANPYGEQWVFIGNPETGEAVLRGGDIGWEQEVKVTAERPCPDLILNEPERMWIMSCFMAMSHLSFAEVMERYNREARQRVAAMEKKLREEGCK